MFGPLVMLGVVGQVDRGLVVHRQRSGFRARKTEISEEGAEVDRLSGGLTSGDDLCLAGGERHCR
eukprot:1049675-Pleurochrysis_carterae.AAC.1